MEFTRNIESPALRVADRHSGEEAAESAYVARVDRTEERHTVGTRSGLQSKTDPESHTVGSPIEDWPRKLKDRRRCGGGGFHDS